MDENISFLIIMICYIYQSFETKKRLIMPWEKSFNEDRAIENAMLLFWKKGYNDTSMADLLRTTGLTKGSFYNAFKSKRDLFVETLKKYDKESRSALQDLTMMDSPIKAILAFFDNLVASTTSDKDQKGCFVVNSLLCITTFDDEVQKIVRGSAQSIETFFKQMIEIGQVRGEISKDISPAHTAKSLFGIMVSIRVLGRGTYNSQGIKALSAQVPILIQ